MTSSGSFSCIEEALSTSQNGRHRQVQILRKYGSKGVELLAAATPIDSGMTAALWRYSIVEEKGSLSLQWLNDSMDDDGNTPVIILLIKGHGLKDGSYVPANNFVSPTILPLLNELSKALMKEV